MYLEILIIVISPLLFAGVAWFFMKSREELDAKERLEMSRVQMYNQRISQDEVKIKNMLEDSRLRGQNIIKLSEKIAQELIFELENALKIDHEKLVSVVPQGESFELKLQAMSGILKSEYVKKILKIVEDLEEYEKKKAIEIEKFTNEQLVKATQNLQQARADELLALQEKLTKYKQEEIALFDRKVDEIVKSASLEVLGKELTVEDHEGLIQRALEKAKIENAL